MRKIALAVALTSALAGCAAPPASDTAPPPGAGRTALSNIGTPFLIALKIPFCAVSAVIAAPLAAAAQLAGTTEGELLKEDLGDGLEQNCAPPYVLTP
ncbi:MAG TPA: hypothetical protein VHT04_09420 [Stellaceae bacterium]|nr:hypothetical protein [Stellaceae bacterium]